MNGVPRIPVPENEPISSYEPKSPERLSIQKELSQMLSNQVEIPLWIGGERVHTGRLAPVVCPHKHRHLLGQNHQAEPKHVQQAIDAALKARHDWASAPWSSRIAIFRKAADLLQGPWRNRLNAATMLNQSKNIHQAEIDSACELIDFWNFNSYFAQEIYHQQPLHPHARGIWNTLEQRGLEGFVFAVTPFNFTAIAGNLPTAPAMMGNTVVWKPAANAMLSAHFIMELLYEAGLPPGVINLVSGPGAEIGAAVLQSPHLAGIHFTGSTPTFQYMWKTVGQRIEHYNAYPRIVGETGGKDFIFAHESADPQALATAMIRGAFEYQGQKCSAASRCYIPKNIWKDVWERALAQLERIKVGDVTDFSNFMNAVIDKASMRTLTDAITAAKESPEAEIIYGGTFSDKEGFFVDPTVIQVRNPKYKTMVDELFGPVLSVYVYEPRDFERLMDVCDETSSYGLTGAIFARDRHVIDKMTRHLVNAAGNFYINDKPTGAVVGQQPFGGARASGTNDKAGAMPNLLRWVSARTIKETFVSPKDFTYPWNQPDA